MLHTHDVCNAQVILLHVKGQHTVPSNYHCITLSSLLNTNISPVTSLIDGRSNTTTATVQMVFSIIIHLHTILQTFEKSTYHNEAKYLVLVEDEKP